MQSEADAMLLDRYLPRYDVTEAHAVVVDADTDLTWQAVRRSDLSRSAAIHVFSAAQPPQPAAAGPQAAAHREPPARR